jgi:hypothetical protein
MSKQFEKLEEAFGLPDMDSVNGTDHTEISKALATAQEIEKEFAKINAYDQHDAEMDELAGLAIQAHKDLQDLGMNVEIRHAGEIFSSSSQMLKIAVDAKNNKVEKKLKLLKLQMEKLRMDRAASQDDTTVEGTAIVLDRNEILRQLRSTGGDNK